MWVALGRHCGPVSHKNSLDMKPGSTSTANNAWADAPTQAKPKSLSVSEINAATAPKDVPQGGVKDCCN